MDSDFDAKANEFDGIWLLKTIKKNLAGLKDKKHMSLKIRDKLLQWILTKQYYNESVHNYMTRFRANTKS